MGTPLCQTFGVSERSEGQQELGRFLQTRRRDLRPEQVGLPASQGSRRVPGLRREEVAQLASISADYYTRLEQGRLPSASESTLTAIAKVLGLDRDEERYLRRLARKSTAHTETDGRIHPLTRRLLDNLTDSPAVILDRRMDVLAWNAMAVEFLVDFAEIEPAQRNWVHLTFRDERIRTMYPDWPAAARSCVAFLRMLAVDGEEDPARDELVAELSAGDPDFRHWWTARLVSDLSGGSKRYLHPKIGEVTLDWQTLEISGGSRQLLLIMSAEPNSPAHRALQQLAGPSLADQELLQP